MSLGFDWCFSSERVENAERGSSTWYGRFRPTLHAQGTYSGGKTDVICMRSVRGWSRSLDLAW